MAASTKCFVRKVAFSYKTVFTHIQLVYFDEFLCIHAFTLYTSMHIFKHRSAGVKQIYTDIRKYIYAYILINIHVYIDIIQTYVPSHILLQTKASFRVKR